MTCGLTANFRGPGTVPSFRHDPEARRWLAAHERVSVPRGHMAAWWERWEFDVRSLLPAIRSPTLVMRREGNVIAPPVAAVDDVIARIPGATGPVVLRSRDLALWARQPPLLADEIERFVVGSASVVVERSDRAFAVVLYTDIVGSTDRAVALGDRRWRELLEMHDHASASQVEHHRGRVVKSTGDGVLAVFDGPARAVRCACAILADLRQIGCDATAGLHAGEIELVGDDVAGIAVHIAQRVMSVAAPGEVIVSRTVKDLVAGSGLSFDERGTTKLKGVPDTWQLHAVACS